MRLYKASSIGLFCISLIACGDTEEPPNAQPGLVINEVVAQNEGVYIDEQGELDDWIELSNTSETAINLSNYTIADSGSEAISLPAITLAPGSTFVLWADDTPEQGPSHLPFKISSSGESLTLYNSEQTVVDSVTIPALDENQAYARFPSGSGSFEVCRYTSPGRTNGNECQSSTAPVVEDSIKFAPFATQNWPTSVVPVGLALNELSLIPANFIEVKNFGEQSVSLSQFSLIVAPLGPDSPLPSWNINQAINLPQINLAPGETASVGLTDLQVEALVLQQFNEGAVVLYNTAGTAPMVVDSVPFMHWPAGASLSRNLDLPHHFKFCANATQDQQNTCNPITTRSVHTRTRGIYTESDFTELANGSGLANIASVKFVMDLQRSNAVHYLSAEQWPLHYTFVREMIDGLPALNRCDPIEEQQFNQGWSLFSAENYFNNTTRRYHLGTLSHHANANIKAVEFTFGDAITASQMRTAFYAATARTLQPTSWFLRPQDTNQISKARSIESELPIVGPNAPFQNIQLQALTSGIAFGTLQFIETSELDLAPLGPRTIVITNDVPNDIDFVGGLITEAFQTPLAHVNILSQGRGTPNLALKNARDNALIAPLLNQLVRFEVSASGFDIRLANLEEAEAFWQQQTGNPQVLTPRLDSTTTSLVNLVQTGIEAIPSIGAKAAQLAELYQISPNESSCSELTQFDLPQNAFAIPMSFYLEHFSASGTKNYLETETQSNLFNTDIGYRRIVLATAQQMILEHPVNATLLATVETEVATRFGNDRVRFRSSSNTEDLSTFNGAGLYESISAELGDDDRPIDIAIKTVWASLWNLRAFEERTFANVDQTQVAMGVLVHRAFRTERANGVAIARNVLNPTRTDQFYFNSQAGEASVTNPAPGVITEQLVYQWPPRTPTITYHSNSSLISGGVISASEIRTLACAMSAIQTHFKPLLDPLDQNRWFTMESEFKFLDQERRFLIKQARPFPMGGLNIPNDCREI